MADHEYENQSGCNEQALLEQGLILPIEMNVQQSSNGRTTYSSSTDNSKCKLVQYEQMDEFDNFCMSLAPKIRRIHGHNPKLAAELQFRIQEQVYMKEAEIYTWMKYKLHTRVIDYCIFCLIFRINASAMYFFWRPNIYVYVKKRLNYHYLQL